MLRTLSVLAFTIAILIPAFSQALPWPAGPGEEIGWMGEPDGLPEGFEPSGIVFHPGRGSVILVDDSGHVCEMSPTGGGVTIWDLDEDLEAVTLADPDGSLVFLGVEHPDAVIEFDLDSGEPTGRQWDLTLWMDSPNNQGLEALTFVKGLFYAGLQADGGIYVFELPTAGDAQHLATISSPFDRDDLSGLHYDPCTEILYAVHDSHDVIVEMDAEGNYLREFDLAGVVQEGVCLIGGSVSEETTIFIAEDANEVWRYEGYPVEPCDDESALPTNPVVSALLGLDVYPNPCNPQASIAIDLPETSFIELSIHDLTGRLIRSLAAGRRSAGEHLFTWDGRSDVGLTLPSGVYLIRLHDGRETSGLRLVLLK